MTPSEIPELRVESVGDDVTYHLPPRPLGFLRLVGLLPIGFSAVWFGALGHILPPLFRQLANHPQPQNYIIFVFMLGFVLAGCAPAGFGLLILFGHSRVRWQDGRLAVSERIGPFGWPRRIPRQRIHKFVVMGGGGGVGNPSLPGTFGGLAAMIVHFERGVPRIVVIGYPRPWLEAIAMDLSSHAGITQSTPPPPVEVYQGLAEELTSEEAEQPADSRVVIQSHDNGVVLEVPPTGLWKGSLGLFPFAIAWCLIISLITAAFVFDGKFDLKAVPFLALFWLIGLGMMAAAINLGCRRVVFTAGPGTLAAVTSSPIGTRQLEFSRGDIADIIVGYSNIEVNHRRVLELQVRLLNGKVRGFMAGTSQDELRWMATVLKKSMGLAAGPPNLTGASGWSSSRPASGPTAKVFSLLIMMPLLIMFTWVFFFRSQATFHPRSHAGLSETNPYLTNLPVASDPTLVFNTFGASGACQTNHSWFVGREAHAEWFVPTLSGNLSEMQLALVPDPGNPNPGKASIILSDDRNGFPGHKLESFSAHASDVTGLLTLESVRKPTLQAGVKYWLGASSRGGWLWLFNNQNIVHNTARQFDGYHWASAGDYCYAAAFSIRIATNQPTVATPPASGDETQIPGNQ